MGSQFYAIQGIKDGLGPDGRVPVRREINEWTQSTDPTHQNQVYLFVLALEYFQQMDPKDRDSYFQIAGIHGMPYKSWDEPNATAAEVKGKGYCVHANCLFPLWHRPYLLLYEQRLYEIMVQKIIPPMLVGQKIKKTLLKAASTWRLPYWDWAKNPRMPGLLCREKLKTRFNGMEDEMDNPLFKFRMPKGQKMGDFGVNVLQFVEIEEPLRYDACVATSRCPTKEQLNPASEAWRDGVVNTARANEYLSKQTENSITGFQYGEAAEMVYRLLTYPMDFVDFATTARDATADSSSATKVMSDMNIEFIHNNIHYWVGGDGGHMSQIPVATFDPVFWFHHCNLDRLFAIWQTLNPDKWFKADGTRIFGQGTIGMGKIVRNSTPFRPFRKDTKGTYWMAEDARDWYRWGYTYPELQPWEYGTGRDLKASLYENINANYGVTRKQAMAKRDEGIPGVRATGDDEVAIQDYAVSIRYSKFAMGGSPFNLEVYLLPKGKTEKTFALSHFVTSVYNFSQPATQNGETVCENCAELEEEGVQVTAYVPLTSYLLRLIEQNQGLRSLEPDEVNELLKGVYWRMTMVGDHVEEDKWKDKLNLKVDVSASEMTFSKDAQAIPDFNEPEIIPFLGTSADQELAEEGVPEPEPPEEQSVPEPEAPEEESAPEPAPEPGSTADINNDLNDTVQEDGLENFYSPDDPYLEEVAKKAASLRADPNNPLNSPEELKDLATLALYQPVIYCDDSGSMSDTGPWRNTEQRWAKQRELVTRMTDIATRAVPDNKGVHFRLINTDLPSADNLDGTAVSRILSNMEPGEYNSTPIGTNLRSKILEPLVYSVINSGRKLERPYLILVLTDGCPWYEHVNTFRNAIVECARFLDTKGYRKDAVRFCLSQIGTHEDASWFLDTFDTDRQALEVLHRTAGHIDERYVQLRQNEAELEKWLLSMLTAPVKLLKTP